MRRERYIQESHDADRPRAHPRSAVSSNLQIALTCFVFTAVAGQSPHTPYLGSHTTSGKGAVVGVVTGWIHGVAEKSQQCSPYAAPRQSRVHYGVGRMTYVLD